MTDRSYDAATLAASDILGILLRSGAKTRGELADLLGLARPTVSLRVDPLITVGLIAPVAEGLATGGRKAERLAIVPDSRVVVAVDIGTTHAKVALVDLRGRVLDSISSPLDVAQGPVEVLEWALHTTTAVLRRGGRSRADVFAIGIGLPGPVDFESGKPANPPVMTGWDGFDVPAFVRKQLDVAVLVDNDVNIMALGERNTAWPDVDHFVFVKIASGIGAGIISSGVLQRGADGMAGDIGHLKIARGAGVPCQCGNTGCIAAIASGAALVAQLNSKGSRVESTRDIADRVRAGDIVAIDAVRQAGRDIGEALVACTSLINPSVIAIGGSLTQAGEHILAGIREMIYTQSMPLATENLTIVQARTGTNAGVIGAAQMALEYAFSPAGIAQFLDSVLTPTENRATLAN